MIKTTPPAFPGHSLADLAERFEQVGKRIAAAKWSIEDFRRMAESMRRAKEERPAEAKKQPGAAAEPSDGRS